LLFAEEISPTSPEENRHQRQRENNADEEVDDLLGSLPGRDLPQAVARRGDSKQLHRCEDAEKQSGLPRCARESRPAGGIAWVEQHRTRVILDYSRHAR
jgi:hypothetical protein